MNQRFGRLVINFLIGLIILNLGVLVIKNLVKRERPTTILKDYSFPSQHAANAFYVAAFAVGLPLLKKKKERLARRYLVAGLYFTAALIGYSRLYFNVHYFSDVLAGGIIGFVLARYFLKNNK